ncbi:MAG TPA: IclR family transcriptional regulator [Caldimonas sp.]|nr:IclR family transcriptional regulator [Caldimonas sp.]HEX2542726.1 IclR family transcriptional regulator [Caldimonas sp.]
MAAVDRALSILDALTEDKVSLAELSKRTDLYKSTVLRLLKSLEKFGYVLRSADGSYRLGPKVLLLGSLYQRHFRTAEIVPPVLEKVSAELHEGASFYIVDDDKRICLHRVETTRAVRDSVHVGDSLPLTVGAAGHVLRAFHGARGERFDEIRRRMYAVSHGERDSETAAYAAPVLGHGNQLVGALSVSGPRYRIEAAGDERIVPVLFKYAKELTRTFGGVVDDPTLAGWNLTRVAGAARKVKAARR